MILPGTLDTEITDAFTLLAVLLVFVFAFFSTVWSRAEEYLEQNPNESEDKRRLKGRLRSQRRLVVTLVVVVIALGALMEPLSIRTVGAWRWNPFDTIRGGLLLLDGFLIIMAIIAFRLLWRLNSKIQEL